MTAKKHHQHPPPPTHGLVRLIGGPHHGQRLSVQRQDQALLFLTGTDGRLSTYTGSTASGERHRQRTVNRQAKRRRGSTKDNP